MAVQLGFGLLNGDFRNRLAGFGQQVGGCLGRGQILDLERLAQLTEAPPLTAGVPEAARPS